ncbi:vacuolar import and degradation protein [Ceratobasidium sp. AG-Ba]|nr:vacuolar import and degradation protein [Ceratobasidium sp. AG-Ba]
MPTENIAVAAHPFDVSVAPQPPQIKVCVHCHGPLDTAELVFSLTPMGPDDVCPSPSVVCSPCADRARAHVDRVMSEPLIPPASRLRRQSTLEPMVEEPSAESDGDTSPAHPQTPPPDVRHRGLTLSIPSRSPVRTPATFAHLSSRVPVAHSVAQHPPSPPPSLGTPPPARRSPATFDQELDPFADVTRLRLKNTRQDCLYPGASFVGIQKSGRNSYNVSVTIVNVDFPGSTLCGYLTIENLTDDHPQLTTYFDAEIIGK